MKSLHTHTSLCKMFYMVTINLTCAFVAVFFSCGKAHADATERLALKLASRFEQVQSLKWRFESDRLIGKPIDWTTASVSSDPFAETKKTGIDTFQPVSDSVVAGKATVINDHLFAIDFVQQGRSYKTYFDGKVFAQRTPTGVDGRDEKGPDVIEITETAAAGDLRGLGFSVSGYHFSPMRIPQLRSCFGSIDESISVAELIQLLRDENIKKRVFSVDGIFTAEFKAFVDSKEAGVVKYSFESDGFLLSIGWVAGEHWSASETVDFGKPVTLESTRLPLSVLFVDWPNSASRRFSFQEWGSAEISDLDFNIPDGALVSDSVNQLAYTNSGGMLNEARAAKLYAMQNGLALPEERSAPTKSRVGMIVLGVLTAMLVIGFLINKRKSVANSDVSKFMFLLVVFYYSFGLSEAHSQQDHQNGVASGDFVRWMPNNGWVLRENIPGMSHISQCGSVCTMLALHLSKREFDPFHVAENLKPSRNGISLLSMKTILSAHGLSVTARKNLDFFDVEKLALQHDFLIVQVPQYQRFDVVEPH